MCAVDVSLYPRHTAAQVPTGDATPQAAARVELHLLGESEARETAKRGARSAEREELPENCRRDMHCPKAFLHGCCWETF